MLHCRFDSPMIAVRENGTLRDEAKPLVCCANGFAVGCRRPGPIFPAPQPDRRGQPTLSPDTPIKSSLCRVFREACKLGCEGIVSKRLGSRYRPERSAHWVKVKNPKAPAVTREAKEDWGRHKR
jgi:hypothetical protein